MRRLFRAELLVLAAVALTATGCGSTDTSALIPTAPIATTVTDNFNGTLTVNGALSQVVNVSAAGNITVTLVTETPDATQPIGMSLGTWTGTVCTVGTGLANDAAVQGAVLLASATAAGAYCVRVYDATGALPNPETFAITIAHT